MGRHVDNLEMVVTSVVTFNATVINGAFHNVLDECAYKVAETNLSIRPSTIFFKLLCFFNEA